MKQVYWCLLLVAQMAWSQTNEENSGKKEGNYEGVGGNPYLFKDWSDGVVKFSNGRIVSQFRIKFDCSANRLLLQYEGASFAAEGNIKEFIIYTRSGKKKDSLVFRKGFPSVDHYNQETFYQVVLPGKATLLRLFAKAVVETKELLSTSSRRFFEDDELFYLLKDGAMVSLPNDKDSLLQKFPDEAGPLAEFISSAQLKLRSADDFIRFAEKYNELLAGKAVKQ